MAEGNAKYASYDGCLYTKDFSTLIRVPSARIWVEIRTGTKEIAGGSFSDCVQLPSLSFLTPWRSSVTMPLSPA